MKERGKSVESDQVNTNFFSTSSSSDVPCTKHPQNVSSVGICAYCLKDKLMNLVCSDCGEQRFSSCSCSSDVSSYRNSSCTVDVGSVGRISFLIENENGSNDDYKTLFSHMKQIKRSGTEGDDAVLLKRSNSCVVEVKKSNGFWRIGKLFEKKKKREKLDSSERNRSGFDEESEVCVMDVSRSRSLTLSSFMDGNLDHEVGGSVVFSSAKVSDFNEYEPRKCGIRGGFVDFGSGVSSKEMVVVDDDDSEFIDLKIDSVSEKSIKEHSVFQKKYDPLPSDVIGSSSCRITVNERGIKKMKNSHMKAWKWIFKHHSAGKKDLNHILKS